MKAAAVGDKNSVLPFKAFGMDVYLVKKPEEVGEVWPRLMEADYNLVMVTEPVAQKIVSELSELTGRLHPAILIIPSAAGPTGFGLQRVRKIVERAVGKDILGERVEESEGR